MVPELLSDGIFTLVIVAVAPESTKDEVLSVPETLSEISTYNLSVPSNRTPVTTGPTASVARVPAHSEATIFPTLSERVVFWSCTSGVAEVSGLAHSVRFMVSPVPLIVYPVTTYPATEAITPEAVPESDSENPSRIPSSFPFPLVSSVVLVRIFGARASVTVLFEKFAR